jgi:hypothetical protein
MIFSNSEHNLLATMTTWPGVGGEVDADQYRRLRMPEAKGRQTWHSERLRVIVICK